MEKTRWCSVFSMRKPIQNIGFPDSFGEFPFKNAPKVLRHLRSSEKEEKKCSVKRKSVVKPFSTM